MNNLTQIDKPLLCYINIHVAAQTPLTWRMQKSNCLELPSIYMMTFSNAALSDIASVVNYTVHKERTFLYRCTF